MMTCAPRVAKYSSKATAADSTAMHIHSHPPFRSSRRLDCECQRRQRAVFRSTAEDALREEAGVQFSRAIGGRGALRPRSPVCCAH